MLTGDKLETSVSVAHACGLFEEGMKQLLLARQTSAEACGECIQNFNKNLYHRSEDSKYALVLDGKSLYFDMKYHKESFQNVCEKSDVVLCCRMSPLQKAEVIQISSI